MVAIDDFDIGYALKLGFMQFLKTLLFLALVYL